MQEIFLLNMAGCIAIGRRAQNSLPDRGSITDASLSPAMGPKARKTNARTRSDGNVPESHALAAHFVVLKRTKALLSARSKGLFSR